MPALLVPFVTWLWGVVVAVLGWLSANLVSALVVAWVTTVEVVKRGLAWTTLALSISSLALPVFTILANVAFFYFVYEFMTFSIDLFNQITSMLNNGTSGSVTLHGVTYNILDNFFAVLDIIGFTDAFIIVKPLLISYVVFVFTYIARKYFLIVLEKSTKIISDSLNNIKVEL